VGGRDMEALAFVGTIIFLALPIPNWLLLPAFVLFVLFAISRENANTRKDSGLLLGAWLGLMMLKEILPLISGKK